MLKKRMLQIIFMAFITVMMLAACSGEDGQQTGTSKEKKDDNDKLQVVTTFSILYDIVKNIGGDHVDIHSLVPIGTDPHQYSPLPLDVQKATDADVVFYNGLNMETGDGWFDSLMETAGKKDGPVYELAEGVEPMYLTSEDGSEEEVNPHAFLDITVGIKYAENALEALKKEDPDHAEAYEKNAKEYITKLEDLHKEYKERVNELPEERRVLVTSERAYQYMAAQYGLKEGYIWEIDTDEQGTPTQITSLVDFVKENDVPALFVESNVDKRPMETVSKETGVHIAGKLFSDEIGKEGDDGDTYIKMLKWNIDTIIDGLSK